MRLAELLGPAPEICDTGPPATLRRRRTVVSATLVVGTALLAATVRVQEGTDGFTVLGLLAAAAWAVGALASGPIPFRPGGRPMRELVIPAALVGVGAFGAFYVAYLVAQHLPGLSGALDTILAKADAGSMAAVLGVALLNGLAEELFFRGAVPAALGRPGVVRLTAVYVVVTMATGNLALVAAAVVMGGIFTLERRASQGVLASIVTHLTWSTLMILVLPR
jgi:membrane protease YdiL (CAAX protease family)